MSTKDHQVFSNEFVHNNDSHQPYEFKGIFSDFSSQILMSRVTVKLLTEPTTHDLFQKVQCIEAQCDCACS